MERARFRIHHAVLCRVVTQWANRGPYSLSNVEHELAFALENEFPVGVASLDLFLRFFVNRAGSERLAIRLWWMGNDRRPAELVAEYGPKVFTFVPGRMIQDATFRLNEPEFPFAGLYAVQVCRRSRKAWADDPWKALRVEYFTVEKRP